ncbi:hypothetical protein RND81_03G021600 [Saponaria officinalis]|uniref:AT-hook motif nuclear-localized protein n=1 Tax=Saponaria officinalis TaxID=3572 RepID=A0AAW1M204_SAPOF
MSASKPGIVSSDNLGPPATTGQPVIHTMQLSFGSDGSTVYKPVTGNLSPPFSLRPSGNGNGAVGADGIGGGGGDGGGKKRRGRPRKYGPDGSMAVAPLNAAPPAVVVSMSPSLGGLASPQAVPQQQQAAHHPLLQNHQQPPQQQPPQYQPPQQQQQQQGVVQGGGAPDSPVKKRGRPPGSANRKQQQQQPTQEQQSDALGSPAIGFTPHVITVNTGEDVSSKIMSFSQNGPRAICILSANGTISSVTLRQAAISGGSVTYEGRFEILSLSGSFMRSENGGGRNRTGGLSVSLAGPDGRVIGGGVAGLLTAASPVQVVVGSFIADGRKEVKSPSPTEPLFTPSRLHSVPGPLGPSSPLSGGTSGSSSGHGSPLNQSEAGRNSGPPGLSNLPWK